MKATHFLITIFLFTTIIFMPCKSYASDSFVIGIAPHTSARVIIEMYQPLRHYLENALKTRVDIVTAPDFDTFAHRALNNSYDLVVTTGQQARLLQVDAGYIPLLTYKAIFKAVAVVPKNNRITTPADLKNTTVLGLSPTSQVTLWGRQWLNEKGLSSLPLAYVSASDSVARLILSSKASLGFMSFANFQKLPPNLRDQLKIYAESKQMPGRIYLLNKRKTAELKEMQTHLWKFAATNEAKQYFDSNKLEGYRNLYPHELESMNSYAAEVRRHLNSEKP